MQGIEPPGKQRRIRIADFRLGLLQSGDDGLDVARTFDQASFGGTAVSGTDVRQRPHHPLHDVAMTLDEPGKQDLVLEAVIDLAAAGEACKFTLAADRDNPSLAHRDVGRKRPRWVHGYDLARRKD